MLLSWSRRGGEEGRSGGAMRRNLARRLHFVAAENLHSNNINYAQKCQRQCFILSIKSVQQVFETLKPLCKYAYVYQACGGEGSGPHSGWAFNELAASSLRRSSRARVSVSEYNRTHILYTVYVFILLPTFHIIFKCISATAKRSPPSPFEQKLA